MGELGPDPWDPWATLTDSPEVLLSFEPLDPVYGGGRYLPATRRHRAAILIEIGLTQISRRCVLAHELLHHRDGCGSWDADQSRRRCDQLWDEAAARLVPPARLARLGWERAEAGGTFDVWDVAEEFRVTTDVARRALHQLDPRRHAILAEAGWEEIA